MHYYAIKTNVSHIRTDTLAHTYKKKIWSSI